MSYSVVLGNLKNPDEHITLTTCSTFENAEHGRKAWRKVLGNRNWIVDRRPGLDTLDHLTLTIEKDTK